MFNIITEQAPQKNLGFMMGVGSLVTAVAPAVGPSVGGWLSETFSWRAIFAALLPLLLVAFVLGMIAIRQSHETITEHFDIPGWLVLAASFTCLIFAIDEGANFGWTSPLIIGLFVAFVVLLALFVHRERTCDHPLIHLEIFHARGYVLGLATIAFMQFTVLGLSFLLPNYAQLVLGAGQTEAGSVLLFGCAVGAIMTPISGQMYDRLGSRKPILSGLCCSLVAIVCFAAFAQNLPTAAMAGVYVLYAFGQGMMYGNNMTCSLSFLPAHVKADGNAMFSTLQQLSGAMGTSVAAAIVNASQVGATDMAAATTIGSHNAFMVLAGSAVIAIVCAHFETKGAER